MEFFLYLLARTILGIFQMMPLAWVGRIGRVIGVMVYYCDRRHRRIARQNLQLCFGHEKSPREITALAKENFRRIGESFCSAAKTATMDWDELQTCCEAVGTEQFPKPQTGVPLPSHVVALGHFGNFEIWARLGQFVPVYKCATTYRGLRQPSLNRLLQSLRTKSGCLFFERRSEAAALKATMSEGSVILGMLADQHAGNGGLRLPFLGRDCSTSAAPAIFALRYHCPLHVGICHRDAPRRWRIEISQEIPTFENGRARSTAAIMSDVNKLFEDAVRRDPANWFWVHNRWKIKASQAQSPKSKAKKVAAETEVFSPSRAESDSK